jgi:CheY-like chemotaxis protein
MAAHNTRPTDLPIGRNVYVLNRDELLRRGLRHLLESNGFTVVGETGSADEAAGRIAGLRPDLVILDDELSDGTGAGVCRTVAEADRSIRCLLLTGQPGEAVLIDSILAGAWGCLSLDDDNTEQLRLIRRALDGNTAYSRRFQPGQPISGARGGPGVSAALLNCTGEAGTLPPTDEMRAAGAGRLADALAATRAL